MKGNIKNDVRIFDSMPSLISVYFLFELECQVIMSFSLYNITLQGR